MPGEAAREWMRIYRMGSSEGFVPGVIALRVRDLVAFRKHCGLREEPKDAVIRTAEEIAKPRRLKVSYESYMDHSRLIFERR